MTLIGLGRISIRKYLVKDKRLEIKLGQLTKESRDQKLSKKKNNLMLSLSLTVALLVKSRPHLAYGTRRTLLISSLKGCPVILQVVNPLTNSSPQTFQEQKVAISSLFVVVVVVVDVVFV